MKRKAALAAALILFTGLSNAVVGHETPEGQMGITSTDSGSYATSSTGPNGTEWRAETSTVNTGCYSGENETLANVTFQTGDSVEGEAVSFQGYIKTSTPCYEAHHSVRKTDENSYVMNITTQSTGSTCVQCIGGVRYQAGFQTDEPFELTVMQNGEEVRTLTHPGYSPSDRETKEQGLLEGFLAWLSRLF